MGIGFVVFRLIALMALDTYIACVGLSRITVFAVFELSQVYFGSMQYFVIARKRLQKNFNRYSRA
jgi:hypothetical protein